MRSQKFLRQKLSVLTSNTDKKEFKNLLAHKIKRHPFAGQFGVKAEVIRQFLYAKVSLLNDPSEVAENTVIIDGYVDDLTSENYEAFLTGELHSWIDFFCKKDYIYLRPKLYYQNGSQSLLETSVCYFQWSFKALGATVWDCFKVAIFFYLNFFHKLLNGTAFRRAVKRYFFYLFCQCNSPKIMQRLSASHQEYLTFILRGGCLPFSL